MVVPSPVHDDAVALNRALGIGIVMDTPKGPVTRLLLGLFNADLDSVGRGIVATKDIPARTIVETSPVLVLPVQDLKALKSTLLNHYT